MTACSLQLCVPALLCPLLLILLCSSSSSTPLLRLCCTSRPHPPWFPPAPDYPRGFQVWARASRTRKSTALLTSLCSTKVRFCLSSLNHCLSSLNHCRFLLNHCPSSLNHCLSSLNHCLSSICCVLPRKRPHHGRLPPSRCGEQLLIYS